MDLKIVTMKKILVDKYNVDLAADLRNHCKTPKQRKDEHERKALVVDAKIRRVRERRESERHERKKLFTHRRATEVGREYQRL